MKLKNFYKKYKFIILGIFSILIPILLLFIKCLVTCFKNGSIYPFDFLFGDALTQYGSFFSYFQDVLNGEQSLLYSFSKNFGGGMLSTYAYYLSSPLNFLIKFFDKSQISIFFVFLVFLKISLSGLTMFIYLKNKVQKLDYKLLIFSSAYALMSYNICYYFNVMWLDIVYLTPLVLLGLDNLFKRNKFILYTLSLMIAIFSNFYIAYMLCIFIVIYFIYNYILSYKDLKKENRHVKIIIKFILFSVLAAGMCSIILIPTIIDFKNFSRFSIESYGIHFDVFKNIFSKLLVNSHSILDSLSRNTPNIYFGTLPLILSILYFFNPNIEKKERVLSLCVVIILLLSLSVGALDLVWHGGSFPNGYVYRFSFLFSFFMIMLAAVNFYKFNGLPGKKATLVFTIYFVISIVCYYQNTTELEISSIIISNVFCFIYLLLLGLNKKITKLLLFLLFIAELSINLNMTFFLLTDLNSRINMNNINDICIPYNSLEDNNHRIDSDTLLTAFDSLLCNTKSVSGSTSTNSKELYETSRNLGFNTSKIGINYNSVPVLATLFGISYESSINFNKDPDYYTLVKNIYLNNIEADNSNTSTPFNVYKLKNTLGIGYLINNDYAYVDNEDPFTYQNNIIKNFTNLDKDVYDLYDLEQIEKYKYRTTLDSSPYIYIFINAEPSYIDEKIGKLYINNQLIVEYKYYKEGIFVINNNWKNQEIEIAFNLNKGKYEDKLHSNLISVASLNKNNFNEAILKLQKSQLDIKRISRNIFEGNIYSDTNKYLFISIPYEKGWKAYVDGKETKIEKAVDSFIKIRIDSGNHDVKLVYTPNGYILGIFITIISYIIFISYIHYKKRRLV